MEFWYAPVLSLIKSVSGGIISVLPSKCEKGISYIWYDHQRNQSAFNRKGNIDIRGYQSITSGLDRNISKKGCASNSEKIFWTISILGRF